MLHPRLNNFPHHIFFFHTLSTPISNINTPPHLNLGSPSSTTSTMEYNCSIIISLVLSLLTTSLFFINYLASSKNRKRLPPSPPSLPIIGHLHLFKKPLHQTLARISSAYGPVVLLHFGCRPILVVSSLSAAEECFTKNDIAFANRPQFPSMKSLSYDFTTLSTASYGPHWRNVRRITTIELLSSARLQSLSDVRRCEVNSLIFSLFRESCGTEDSGGAGRGPVEHTLENSVAPAPNKDVFKFKKVELRPRLFGLTFNVMMQMISGKRYDDEEGSKVAKAFRDVVEEAVGIVGASNVSDFLPVLRWMDFGGVKKRMRRVVEKTEMILQGLIDEKKKKCVMRNKKKSSMLEVLLSLQEDDPEYYTDKIIKAMIVTLFFAGTDTSTDTVEWAMTLLVNHPKILQKSRNEIDSLIKTSCLLQEDDLPNLPYLQAIINETLRLCPAAPLLLPHESLEECSVGGYHIPRGTMLLVNAWAIHRSYNVGENPTEFKPERFLSDGGNGCKIIPFGMGRRKCPGDGLAIKIVGLVLGSLIQCFEWERSGEGLVDMDERGGLTLHKVNPLQVMYRPRKNMINVLSQI